MTDQAIEAVIEETLVAELDKGPSGMDQKLRVRKLTVDGVEFIDVRDYTPALELYGRGALIPREMKSTLLAALRGI